MDLPSYIIADADSWRVMLDRHMGPARPASAIDCPACRGKPLRDEAPNHYRSVPATYTRCLHCDGHRWITPPETSVPVSDVA